MKIYYFIGILLLFPRFVTETWQPFHNGNVTTLDVSVDSLFMFLVRCHRPLSRRLDRCDRVIQDEPGDSNGGNV